MFELARKVAKVLPFIALLATVVVRADEAPVAVDKVHAFRDGDIFTAELQTSTAWIGADVNVQFFKDSIQVDIPGAFLNKGKQLIKVEDRAFKSVYATQFDATTVRTRFTVKPGFTAKSFANRFHVKRSAGSMTFEINGDAQDTKTFTQKIGDEVNKIAVNDESNTDAMPAKLVAGATAAAATVTKAALSAGGNANTNAGANQKEDEIALALDNAKTVAINGDIKADVKNASDAAKKIDTNKLPENAIPVLSTVSKEKKSESNPMFRLLITLGVAVIVLGAAAFGMKKLARRQGKVASKTRINILTNHHLGPKKNLMIVQVAGETLLLGVTDQNITMLKTLALIDDEVPAELPQRFNHTMEDFIGEEEEQSFAMQGLDQVRDSVSARLKNLRNL